MAWGGRAIRWLAAGVVVLLVASAVWGLWKPLPEGISFAGTPHPARDVRFLADLTWVDDAGTRHVEQHIFDEVLALVRGARRQLLLDMFLFNDFQGDGQEETRALYSELTQALLAQKRRHPRLEITLVTDPINTVYGGLPSPEFQRMRQAGINLVTTDLDPLRDSNPAWSAVWRWFLRPFGTGGPGTLPNPFGPGRVSLRAYLRLLNFKANHRKLVVADTAEGWAALVTSANPHDGSSAHGNAAIRFTGPAVADLVETERAVAAFSGAPLPSAIEVPAEDGDVTVQVLTEGAIARELDALLAEAGPGDALDVAVFYLSDRAVVRGLVAAHERGATVRVILDPNKDAFGRQKNGVPNRPVAAELVDAGIPVRWCDTHGEQCHTKLVLARRRDRATLIAGSANFTRRNLRDFNLETNVALRGPAEADALRDARAYFERIWENEPGRRFTVGYEVYAEEVGWKRWYYRFGEVTGVGTY